MDNYKEPIKIEITQDKLVDLLLHTATREDIAKFANEAKNDNENLRNEIIFVRNELKADIAKISSDAKTDNEKLRSEMKTDMSILSTATLKALENFETRMDRQFQKIDHRYNWIIGTIIGCSIALGGFIIAIINFTFAAH